MHPITLRAPLKSFCEEKITRQLIAHFMQTIKEMFYNILKCSCRFFSVSSLYHWTLIFV